MKNFSERLLMILATSGLQQNEFASKVGIDSTSVKNYLKGRNPQHSVIGKIIAAFPEYNKEWITLGVGPMLVGGPEPTDNFVAQKVTPNEDSQGSISQQILAIFKEQVASKDAEIQFLRDMLRTSLAKFEVSPEGTGEMTLSRGELDTEGLTKAA